MLTSPNILIDYLNGVGMAREEIERYDKPLISPITWMEVMIGAAPDGEMPVRAFLSRFSLVSIDRAVSEESVRIRRSWSIRLPDAIIWASARVSDALLISRNTLDFPEGEPGVRVPYWL